VPTQPATNERERNPALALHPDGTPSSCADIAPVTRKSANTKSARIERINCLSCDKAVSKYVASARRILPGFSFGVLTNCSGEKGGSSDTATDSRPFASPIDSAPSAAAKATSTHQCTISAPILAVRTTCPSP